MAEPYQCRGDVSVVPKVPARTTTAGQLKESGVLRQNCENAAWAREVPCKEFSDKHLMIAKADRTS